MMTRWPLHLPPQLQASLLSLGLSRDDRQVSATPRLPESVWRMLTMFCVHSPPNLCSQSWARMPWVTSSQRGQPGEAQTAKASLPKATYTGSTVVPSTHNFLPSCLLFLPSPPASPHPPTFPPIAAPLASSRSLLPDQSSLGSLVPIASQHVPYMILPTDTPALCHGVWETRRDASPTVLWKRPEHPSAHVSQHLSRALYWLPTAAKKLQKRGLQQENWTLQVVEARGQGAWGCAPIRGSGGGSFLPPPALGLQVPLGLWPVTPVSACVHVAFPLCLPCYSLTLVTACRAHVVM